jgi:hypothetical protein
MDRSPAAVAALPARKCETPLQTSKPTSLSVSAIKALEEPDWRYAVTAVKPHEAQLALDQLEGRDTLCSASEAATFAEQLVNFYPAREIHDARTYISGMTAIMASFPSDFAKRVCDPVNGIPSRLKFLPTLAEVKEALTAEDKRRVRIAANARYVIEQAEKRAAEAEEARRWEAERPAAEERFKRVQEILKGLVRPEEGEGACG